MGDGNLTPEEPKDLLEPPRAGACGVFRVDSSVLSAGMNNELGSLFTVVSRHALKFDMDVTGCVNCSTLGRASKELMYMGSTEAIHVLQAWHPIVEQIDTIPRTILKGSLFYLQHAKLLRHVFINLSLCSDGKKSSDYM